MESRIRTSEFFIEPATKRVENARQEVDDAKAKMASAEATLTAELSSSHDGEQRHAAHLVEVSRVPEQPPPTLFVDFAAELAQLRSLVAELQREREELGFELGQRGASTLFEEARPRKSTRSLAITVGSGSGRNPSALMETLVDGAAAGSHRVHPTQQ